MGVRKQSASFAKSRDAIVERAIARATKPVAAVSGPMTEVKMITHFNPNPSPTPQSRTSWVGPALLLAKAVVELINDHWSWFKS